MTVLATNPFLALTGLVIVTSQASSIQIINMIHMLLALRKTRNMLKGLFILSTDKFINLLQQIQ